MDVDVERAQKLGKNVMTVRQQVEHLKAWVKMKGEELQRQKEIDLAESKIYKNDEISNPVNEYCPTKTDTDLESIKIRTAHKDFQSLLDEKLQEESCTKLKSTNKMVQKRPFLKKGEGLTRYRIKPTEFRTKNQKSTYKNEALTAPLAAFEQLEQKLDDSSFCSTSSMVAQLMEDSIKSTPIKSPEFTEPKEGNVIKHTLFNVDSRTLGVIDEEPSRFDYSQDTNRDQNSERKYESASDSSECSSSCSCCEDTTNYTSTSVSIFAEETVYSPQKKILSRAVRCTKIDQSSYCSDRPRDVQETGDSEENLKSLIQTRLLELEAEIDVFKTENSHLVKLRNDYEKEYDAFCKERVTLLAKIREEHLSGAKELENERKQLQAEKRAFDKYMKDIKNRPNKQEKEEIRLLKEEIKLLKEEINKKESRWGAAQARIRTEMKLLKDHNSKLQEELKDLKKTQKKVTFAPVLKKSKSSSSINVKPKTETPKSIDRKKNASSPQRFQFDHPASDSGILTENFQSSSEDSISESLRRSICLSNYLSADKDDTADEISVSELSSKDTNDFEVSEFTDSNGNREKLYPDGRKEIWCANGSVKKISADGKITKTIFYNGDVEEAIVGENLIKYYHAASRTWHSKFSDGLEIKEFPNGQIEKYFKDGSTEIISPDGTVFTISTCGEKKWNLKDGSVVVINEEKQEKQIVFPNGQIETHTPEFKKREYLDGTVKIIYNASGMQETRYANGRIRLKAENGTLISDTEIK